MAERKTNSLPRNLADTRQQMPVGAVLVCGGGIAGIQAALDLSSGGFRVYLADSAPSIGGAMAKLDKTFPTGDCATCILSPKLVECARDINIGLHTLTEVESVEGQAGRFKVTLRRRPRYVSERECNGCGDCITACPIEISGYLDCGLGRHKAVDKPYAQAVPNLVAIDKPGEQPCRAACPLGQHTKAYIALIARGKYREAVDLIRQTNPLPSICGYVCHHPCESVCERGRFDDPIAIRALKRFAVEKAAEMGYQPELPRTEPFAPGFSRGERVAVVGAGPAGLAAADRLARLGYGVTVFEATDVVGGMLRLGIPDFRLPRDVVDREVEAIRAVGVEIRTGVRLGKDITIDGLFGDAFRAIFVAVGAYKGTRLGCRGEDLEGVLVGLDFIQWYNLGQPVEVGSRVAVIGGGNAAVDVARVAKRLGANEVTIVYRRTRHEMPADQIEVAEAVHEGVRIEFLSQPTQIIGQNGRVAGMECVRMALTDERDSSGRRRPVPIEGSQYVLPCDTVLVAIGQSPNTGLSAADSIRLSPWGSIEVDPDTLQTSRE
ncbi:FAD-dependent oxidoreductase, partial [Candidatus Sumerlaeota bacterium]|nr:FAD-dependent oxidoreductase [Candidatus Sumerlaeota bacterium]